MCDCDICSEHRRIQNIRNTGSIEQLRELIDHLENENAELATDNEYHNLILKGEWSSSERQLTRGLLRSRLQDSPLLKFVNGEI